MLSFVIPAHNEEEIIEETLTRLRAAARAVPHEIILSDDGSTDGTVEKASPLADHVVRYQGEKPKTIGAARNRGTRLARYPLIVFLDSDVQVRDPEVFFPKVLENFRSDPKLVAMTVTMRVVPEAETRADAVVLAAFDAYFRFANNVLGFGLTHGKCMIVRAEAFRRVGGFNESIVASEDADLFMRLSKIGSTLFDPALRIYFSGRRAHAVGWVPLLWRWTLNGIWIVAFKRAYSHDWQRDQAPAHPPA